MFDLSPERIRDSGESISESITVIAYGEYEGMGMGLLSTGEAYLSQRGLAALCGVQNAHIGTISRDWHEDRPRITTIRERLARYGDFRDTPHRILTYQGRRLYCYDLAVCQAVMDYYAVDAGSKTQAEAQANRIRFRGNGLLTFIQGQFPRAAQSPLRFIPIAESSHIADDVWTTWTAHIWGLYVMSFWLAAAYVKTMQEQAQSAEWNRLGLYVPLKAILEIQQEVMNGFLAGFDQDALRINGTFSVK